MIVYIMLPQQSLIGTEAALIKGDPLAHGAFALQALRTNFTDRLLL